MGANWYHCISVFGYKIQVPEGTTYRKFVKKLWGPSGIVRDPFMITALLPDFHSRMEGADYDELTSFDNIADIVIGFYPDADLNKMIELNKELFEYITDNPIFEGIDIDSTPDFYSGIDWFEGVGESDSDDDSDPEDEEESDEESEDESNEESKENYE